MRIGDQSMFIKSTYFNVEKDLATICTTLLENKELIKLLLLKENDVDFTMDNALKKKVLKDNIRIEPFVEMPNNLESQIIVHFDDFYPNAENPKYMDKTLSFDIICPPSTWNMGDFKLRPYKIAGYLDGIWNKKSLNGSFSLKNIGGSTLILNNEVAGFTLFYQVIYSEIGDKIE